MEMDKVKCHFCDKTMRQGSIYAGFGLNKHIYWCDSCGSSAIFMKDGHGRKIKSFSIGEVEYEGDDEQTK